MKTRMTDSYLFKCIMLVIVCFILDSTISYFLPYILIYCLIAFVRSYLFKLESLSLIESMIFCILTIFAQECVVYWLMWITNMTRYPIVSFLTMRILPTLILNLVLFVGVYWVYNKVKIEVE